MLLLVLQLRAAASLSKGPILTLCPQEPPGWDRVPCSQPFPAAEHGPSREMATAAAVGAAMHKGALAPEMPPDIS